MWRARAAARLRPGRVLVASEGQHERFRSLIDAARGGDPNARDELFRLAQTHFEFWIRKHPTGLRFKQRHADLDLFQETALRALERLATVQAKSPAEFLAWFDEILMHKHAELLRHDYDTKKRGGTRQVQLNRDDGAQILEDAEADHTADPCLAAARREQASAIIAALCELSERERRIIDLRFSNGSSYRSIADELGESAEAIRATLRRAISRLRERLYHIE